MSNGTAVIAGVAEADKVGKVPEKNILQLQAEAAKNAIEDAGLEKDDVEGLFIQGSGLRERYHFPQVTAAEYLGIEPTISSSNDMGGATPFAHVQYAKLAIEAGRIDTALITYGSTNYSDRKESRDIGDEEGPILTRQYEQPYGIMEPISQYAMIARRYMHEYGVTREDLAHVAVSTREWAKRNPKAMQQDDLTVQDVLTASPVCEPLHKYDCCLINDAGGAVVVTRSDMVPDESPGAVEIAGLAQTHTHEKISQMPDLTVTGARDTSRRAYEMASVEPDDIDVAELYDSFTITAALLTENVGLTPPGEGTTPFVEGETAPGGSLPINTNGGGLSYLHPGTYGIFPIIEAVRQVRGTAGQRQVPDARTALAHGSGGILSTHATMILEGSR